MISTRHADDYTIKQLITDITTKANFQTNRYNNSSNSLKSLIYFANKYEREGNEDPYFKQDYEELKTEALKNIINLINSDKDLYNSYVQRADFFQTKLFTDSMYAYMDKALNLNIHAKAPEQPVVTTVSTSDQAQVKVDQQALQQLMQDITNPPQHIPFSRYRPNNTDLFSMIYFANKYDKDSKDPIFNSSLQQLRREDRDKMLNKIAEKIQQDNLLHLYTQRAAYFQNTIFTDSMYAYIDKAFNIKNTESKVSVKSEEITDNNLIRKTLIGTSFNRSTLFAGENSPKTEETQFVVENQLKNGLNN